MKFGAGDFSQVISKKGYAQIFCNAKLFAKEDLNACSKNFQLDDTGFVCIVSDVATRERRKGEGTSCTFRHFSLSPEGKPVLISIPGQSYSVFLSRCAINLLLFSPIL